MWSTLTLSLSLWASYDLKQGPIQNIYTIHMWLAYFRSQTRQVNFQIIVAWTWTGGRTWTCIFLCKSRQILPRPVTCFHGPDKTTISSSHIAKITLPHRSKDSATGSLYLWLRAAQPLYTRHGASTPELSCCTKLIWMKLAGTWYAHRQLIFHMDVPLPIQLCSRDDSMTQQVHSYSTISSSVTAASCFRCNGTVRFEVHLLQ